jgi:uncharacterized membrane-anchored protein YjiN (DUF445 family)
MFGNLLYKKISFHLKTFIGIIMITSSMEGFTTQTIETTNLEMLLEISNKNTLILTDITNTLYQPCNTMSDKKWRTYLANRVHEVITDSTLALKVAHSMENMIVNEIDKELVHKNAPAVIEELQNNGIPIIAISLKNWSAPYDPNFGILTSNHLKKLGIDLEKSVPLLGKINNEEIQKSDKYTFAKGIIFTNKKPLEEALDAFLNRLERKPEQIILLDNSDAHKEKLETVIKAHHIALTFVKHKPSESHENSFDPTLGTIEFLEYINGSNIILDEEALKIKEGNSSVDYDALLNDSILNFG